MAKDSAKEFVEKYSYDENFMSVSNYVKDNVIGKSCTKK